MGKIDKLWNAVECLFRSLGIPQSKINQALSEQGLVFKNGEIMNVETFFMKDEYYVCIMPCGNFKVGGIYKCTYTRHISDGCAHFSIIEPEKYFRLATDEEITQHLNSLISKDSDEPKANLQPSVGQKVHETAEPKFKKGDWVVNTDGHVCQIERTTFSAISKEYGYDCTDGHYISRKEENSWRSWDISKDAKEGDVLYTKGGIGSEKTDIIFIFKGIGSRDYLYEPCVDHYCYICEDGFHIVQEGKEYMGVLSNNIKQGTCPATKEQKETLFKAMAEAGYSWNAETKALEEIQEPDLDNTNGTNTIKFNEEEGLSEFENAFIGIYKEYGDGKYASYHEWMEFVKDSAAKLLAIARKQIEPEIREKIHWEK